MIVLCIKCKLPFDNGDNMHLRVCEREHPKKKYVYVEHKFYWEYMFNLQKHFQDPIYQFYRLLNDEWVMPTTKRQLQVEEITVI